jgi:HEAT repeat protein
MMRYFYVLAVLLWSVTSWGAGLDRQTLDVLGQSLQRGTTREKLLALSLLPKPACHAPSTPESLLVLQAMGDADPLVREMATYHVRSEITGVGTIADRLDDGDYFPLSPDNPDNRASVKPGRRATRRGVCGSPPLVEALLRAARDTSSRVRMESALSLGFTGDPRNVPTLSALVRDPDPFVRAAAGFALGEVRAKEGAPAAASLATVRTGDWRDFFARREALKALRKIWVANFRRMVAMGPEGNVFHEQYDETLRTLAVKTALGAVDDASVRREAYELLAEMTALEAMVVLRTGVTDPDPVVRLSATRGLLRLARDRQAVGECARSLSAASADRDPRVRAAAVRGLGGIAGMQQRDIILRACDDPDENVRLAAIEAVRNDGAPSLERLASALGGSKEIRSAALVSLYRVSRTEADFAAVREKRRPAAARPGRSYIWIRPDPDRVGKERSAAPKKVHASAARLHNDTVVDRVVAAYPGLSRDEKIYALEVLSRFDNTHIAPFLVRCGNDGDPVAAVKAMEIALAYAPAASLRAVAAKLASKNDNVSDAAYRLLAGTEADFPVGGIIALAEDPSPKTRMRFFQLVKGLSDPLLPPICLKGLGDTDASVRLAASAFFQEHADPRAVRPLAAMLGRSRSETSAAVRALAGQDASAIEPLLAVVTEREGTYELDDKIEALFGIVNFDRERTVPALLAFLEKSPDPDEPVANNVIRALVGLEERRVVPFLLNCLNQGKGKGSFAALALFQLADPSSLQPLRAIIESPDEPLERRKAALFAYANGGAEATGYLLAFARRSAELRQAAVEHLQIQKPEDLRIAAKIAGTDPDGFRDILPLIGGASYRIHVERTAGLLHDTDPAMVRGAILLLRATGNPTALEPLRGLTNAPDPSVRELAAEAIRSLEEKKRTNPKVKPSA